MPIYLSVRIHADLTKTKLFKNTDLIVKSDPNYKKDDAKRYNFTYKKVKPHRKIVLLQFCL